MTNEMKPINPFRKGPFAQVQKKGEKPKRRQRTYKYAQALWRADNPGYMPAYYAEHRDIYATRRFNADNGTDLGDDAVGLAREAQGGVCVCGRKWLWRKYIRVKAGIPRLLVATHADIEILCKRCRRARDRAGADL